MTAQAPTDQRDCEVRRSVGSEGAEVRGVPDDPGHPGLGNLAAVRVVDLAERDPDAVDLAVRNNFV